jgi:hypothetical protein
VIISSPQQTVVGAIRKRAKFCFMMTVDAYVTNETRLLNMRESRPAIVERLKKAYWRLYLFVLDHIQRTSHTKKRKLAASQLTIPALRTPLRFMALPIIVKAKARASRRTTAQNRNSRNFLTLSSSRRDNAARSQTERIRPLGAHLRSLRLCSLLLCLYRATIRKDPGMLIQVNS